MLGVFICQNRSEIESSDLIYSKLIAHIFRNKLFSHSGTSLKLSCQVFRL